MEKTFTVKRKLFLYTWENGRKTFQEKGRKKCGEKDKNEKQKRMMGVL